MRSIAKPKDKIELILLILSLTIIASGISVRIVAYLYNRSLWLDEAFLASSVIQRNYLELTKTLDFLQGAPIGYLWLVKSLAYIFGTSEYILRLPSLLAGITSIYVFYKVLKEILKDKRPYIATAFYATIPYLVYYSIEFKPYMLDGLITLVSLLIFHRAINNRIKTIWLIVYSSLVIWFSFPVIFTLTTFYLLWFGWSLWEKDKKVITKSLLAGSLTLLSFIIYYIFFYSNLNQNQSSPWWGLLKFPIIPTKLEDIIKIKCMVLHYLSVFGKYGNYFAVLATPIGLFYLCKHTPKYIPIYICFLSLLILIISSLGYFGFLNRILLFIIPVHAIIIGSYYYNLFSEKKYIFLFSTLLLILINYNTITFFSSENVFRENQEVKPLVEYLDKNSKQIPIYICRRSIPQYEYYTGYNAKLKITPTKPFIKNNIIYGSYSEKQYFKKLYSWDFEIKHDVLQEDIEAIIKNDTVYLLMGQSPQKSTEALFQKLNKYGSVNEIKNVYETKLYLFEKHKL